MSRKATKHSLMSLGALKVFFDAWKSLKRLDKLTHEEARMAIAENLRATHAVDERVRGVTEQVLAVDDRVAGVDDRLANVNDKVEEVIHGMKNHLRS